MSRGLGEVQIQALGGFIWKGVIVDEWRDLRAIKRCAWGDRSDASMYPDSTLAQVRKSGEEHKNNHHGSFRRALELLVKSGYLEVRNVWPTFPELERFERSQGMYFYSRRTPDREYRLTDKGKDAVTKFHT